LREESGKISSIVGSDNVQPDRGQYQ